MSTNAPLSGMRVGRAIIALAPEPQAVTAQQLTQLELMPTATAALLRVPRRILWLELCSRVQRGEVQAFGVRYHQIEVEEIPPQFFDLAEPDYDQDAVTNAAGLTFYGVRFLLAKAMGAPAAGPPASKRFDYRKEDAPLITEMQRLIATGAARSPWDAAQAVSGRAAGKGSGDSKVKRLVKGFNAL
jgi:hypothetical protein